MPDIAEDGVLHEGSSESSPGADEPKEKKRKTARKPKTKATSHNAPIMASERPYQGVNVKGAENGLGQEARGWSNQNVSLVIKWLSNVELATLTVHPTGIKHGNSMKQWEQTRFANKAINRTCLPLAAVAYTGCFPFCCASPPPAWIN